MTGRDGIVSLLSNVWFRRAFAAAVVVSCVVYLGNVIARDMDRFRRDAWPSEPLWLAGALLLNGLTVVMLTAGWASMMAGLIGPREGRKPEHHSIYWYSNLAKRVPGFLWFVVGRIYLYRRTGVPGPLTVLGVTFEGLTLVASGLFAFALGQAIAFLLNGDSGLLYVAAGAAVVGAVALSAPWLSTFSRWLWRRTGSPTTGAESRRHLSGWMARWQPVYLLAWAVGGVMLFAVLRSLHPVAWEALPTVIAAWSLAGVASTALFVVPGGLGIREASLVFWLTGVVPPGVAVAGALLFRLTLMVGELGWSLLFLAVAHVRKGTLARSARFAGPTGD